MFAFVALLPVSFRTFNVHKTNMKRGNVVPRMRRSTLTYIRAALEPLVLSEDAVQLALDEVVVKLGSVFGNSAENRDVGITGEVELASLDGPIVVLRLKGRFWHKRNDVVRIPFFHHSKPINSHDKSSRVSRHTCARESLKSATSR